MDLLDRLSEILGPAQVLRGAEALAHGREWTGHYAWEPLAVLRPGTTEEVAAVLRLAHETGTPVVPLGGNTGLNGGTVAQGALMLSLARMTRIRDLNPAARTVVVEAGVVLETLHALAAIQGLAFPLTFGAKGSAMVGGFLSTNAGGSNVVRYGSARALCLGLEVVLADGRIWNGLTGLHKDNTGYDLRDLMIGAEGTLGIITAATLKLFPKPRAVATAFVGLRSPQHALTLLQLARDASASELTSFELIAEIAVRFSVAIGNRDPLSGRHPWYVLLEVSSPRSDARDTLEAILTAALEQEVIDDAVIAESLSQRAAFWKLREEISPSQKPEGGSIKHDVSVPVAAVPAFIEQANDAVTRLIPGARPVPFGHLGDGNIHYNVSQPVGADAAAFLARWHEVNAVVFAIVQQLGGSISAEHGIGVLKRDELPMVKDKVAMELMRSIKAVLDPLGIMNPGKVL